MPSALKTDQQETFSTQKRYPFNRIQPPREPYCVYTGLLLHKPLGMLQTISKVIFDKIFGRLGVNGGSPSDRRSTDRSNWSMERYHQKLSSYVKHKNGKQRKKNNPDKMF